MISLNIAEIHPMRPPRKKKRPIGLAKGQFTVPPAFFEPLPDEVLETFKGNAP